MFTIVFVWRIKTCVQQKYIKSSKNKLTDAAYNQLLYPSIADKPKLFSGVQNDLFDKVIMTYMASIGPAHPRKNTIQFHKE